MYTCSFPLRTYYNVLYNIVCRPTTNSDGTGHSRDPSLTGSHFMDDTTITESAEGLSTTCEDYASTLNREHQRTPSVSSGGSCSSAGSRKRRGKKLVCILYIISVWVVKFHTKISRPFWRERFRSL